MIGVSGRGLWPGHDPLEAQLAVFGDLSEAPEGVRGLPFLPQLPERGVGADDLGRTAALLAETPVELGTHGWKLADHCGSDLARAQEFLRHDLEALAISAAGAGPLTLQVVGPWTLAATLWRARGDRVLSDPGAVRGVTQALGQGLVDFISRIRQLVPRAELTVQFDESLLGQVNAGVLPTFSGYSRLPVVHGPELVEGLRSLLDVVHGCDVRSVVDVGEAWVGIPAVVLSGAGAVGVTLGAWNEQGWELAARALERGLDFWPALPHARVSQCSGPAVHELVDLIGVPWGRIGLPVNDLNKITLIQAALGADHLEPGHGASRASTWNQDAARGDLASLIRVARTLAERANG